MAKCPNISHPDWKSLVAKHGKEGAIKKYIENGFDIPSPDGAKSSKRGKSTVQKGVDLMGDFFKSKSTLDHIEKHPETLSKMIDELKSVFPDVKIYKDAIIDENGNAVVIPAGKVGMHYRSALTSAIAYANDSYMETVPHEFAHEYIDMFREVPVVKEAIAKYGEERLVTLIGRRYAGNQMSNGFETFLKDFWKAIRNVFGHGNVVDILTDSFAKNERLGEPLSRGNAIYNYQDSKPLHKDKTILDQSKNVSRGAVTIELKNKEAERVEIAKELEDLTFEGWWNELKKMSSRLAEGKDNYAGIDNSFIAFINDVIANEKESLPKISQKIQEGDKSKVELTEREQLAYDTIIKLSIIVKHKQKVFSSYISEGKMVNETSVDKITSEELETTYQKKEKHLGDKHKYIQEIAKGINKVVSWATNSRLWAKYLSGGENTMFSTLVYKGLNDAREVRARFSQTFSDIFTSKPSSYMDGSIFHNPNADISDLETTTFSLEPTKNTSSSVQLTKAEILNVYLMLRQKGAKEGLKTNGLQLKAIKGRAIDLSDKFKLSEKQLTDIQSTIENDAEAMTLVAEIDKAMKYNYESVNKVFEQMEGYTMEKIENYFPVFHGTQNLDVGKSKNIVNDMRSLRLRMESDKAVRIEDPFQVLSGINLSSSSYVGYAIPIHNAQKAIDSSRSTYDHKDSQKYFDSLQGTINKIQDSGTLFSTQGEQEATKMINKVQGNFAVALLAKNLGVVFKQQVSLITAQEEINKKYITKAGASLGPISFINPFKLLKQLGKGDETMMPIEWQQLTEDSDYKQLIKHPLFRERFEGVVSRESGEAVMGQMIEGDKIKIPFTNKYITKSRLMQSITIMDTLTILRLYTAVKLETQDRMGEADFQSMTDTQIEQHNVNRLQDIVDKTQPTFDQTNRTKLSQSSNPIMRGLTMFSSATQKMSMLLLEGTIDYANNPTKENKMKLFKRVLNVGLTTSIMLTTIDLMRHALLNGWTEDDDDELFEKYALSSLKSTVGSFQGIGTPLNIIISQLDSNPWYQTAQDPFQHVIQEGSEAVANLAKGNFDRALKQSIGATFKLTGLPISIINNTQKLIERGNEK